MLWKLGLTSGLALLGAGELPVVGDFGPWLQWGALGILGVTLVRLFNELAAQRADAKSDREAAGATIKAICDRWDGWEKTRHEDHETLNETLTQMRENCAAVTHAAKPP